MPVDELRRVIESAFLPLPCRCTVSHDDSLVVTIADPSTGEPLLSVLGVPRSQLATTAELSRFVRELRQQVRDREADRQLRERAAR